jgi:hypothetical protein
MRLDVTSRDEQRRIDSTSDAASCTQVPQQGPAPEATDVTPQVVRKRDNQAERRRREEYAI